MCKWKSQSLAVFDPKKGQFSRRRREITRKFGRNIVTDRKVRPWCLSAVKLITALHAQKKRSNDAIPIL